MSKDPTQVLTAGVASAVFVAPIGEARPADTDVAIGGNWTNLGYIDSAPDYTRDRSVQDYVPWNSLDPVKSFIESDMSSLTLILAQTNREVFELYWGEGTWTALAEGAEWTPDETNPLVERAVALEIVDGDEVLRMFWPRAQVSDIGDFSIEKADAIKYEMTFKRLAPTSGSAVIWQTNVADLVTGDS